MCDYVKKLSNIHQYLQYKNILAKRYRTLFSQVWGQKRPDADFQWSHHGDTTCVDNSFLLTFEITQLSLNFSPVPLFARQGKNNMCLYLF